MKIRISQKLPIRGYQIPTFGMRELKNGELIEKDSKLGKALLIYFPDICKLVEDIETDIETKQEQVEDIIEPKEELLMEEPEAPAEVEEIPQEEQVKLQEENKTAAPKRGRKSTK
jgi:hypothetical protein